jgi:elongation factor G
VAHSIKRIRTLALVGQSGAGKTTLAEALLAKAGAIPALGAVQRGTTVCDYTALEKQLQHSLKLAVASFDFRATRISWAMRCRRSPPSRPRRSSSTPRTASR